MINSFLRMVTGGYGDPSYGRSDDNTALHIAGRALIVGLVAYGIFYAMNRYRPFDEVRRD